MKVGYENSIVQTEESETYVKTEKRKNIIGRMKLNC